MATYTLKHVHLNRIVKTYHVIYKGKEIISTTLLTKTDSSKIDVRYHDGTREVLEITTPVEVYRK